MIARCLDFLVWKLRVDCLHLQPLQKARVSMFAHLPRSCPLLFPDPRHKYQVRPDMEGSSRYQLAFSSAMCACPRQLPAETCMKI